MSNGRQIGPYLVQGELGRGAMGVVYRVVDAAGRELALKLIQRHKGDSEILARFAREAQTMAAVTHPHIVRVHELGESAQGPYIVTEIVTGTELEHVLKSGPLEPELAATVARKLADALAALHAAGIIHRDLKPGNVILREPDHEPVLLDFGLARDDSEDRLTKTGTLLGTPNYMAPEQADGAVSKQGPWTDVYGLGAILFALLSGRPPFSGGVYEVLQKVMQDPPTWPSEEREVPFALEAIVRKAMAKDPHRRYTNATQLRDELDRYLAGDWSGLGAPPPPVIGTRNALIAAVAIALGVLFGLGVWATQSPDPSPEPTVATTVTADPAPTKPPQDATFEDTSPPAKIEAWLKAWPKEERAASVGQTWLRAKLQHPVEVNRYRGPGQSLSHVGARVVGLTLQNKSQCLLRVWDLARGEQGPRQRLPLRVAEAWTRARAGSLLAIGGRATTHKGSNLLLFRPTTKTPIACRPSDLEIVGLAFSPDASRLAIFGPHINDAGQVLRWEVQVFDAGLLLAGKQPRPLASITMKGEPRGLGIASDNVTVVILRGVPDGMPISPVEVWNTRTQERTVSEPMRGLPAYLVPHPDGRRFLAAISSSYRLVLVDALAQPIDVEGHLFLGKGAKAYKTEALKDTPAAHSSTLRGSIFSRDGTRLYSVSGHAKPAPHPFDGELRVWDVETKTEIARVTHLDQRFVSIDLLPTGHLVTSSVIGHGRQAHTLIQTWDVRERP